MNITIRQRILLSFAAILAAMLVLGGIALQRLSQIEAEENLLRRDSIPGMRIASQVLVAWHANYSLVHAHVIADDDATMQGA